MKRILHLYPDLMSLYGEYANLSVLRRLLNRLGEETELAAVTGNEAPDLSTADLIYMGSGTERSSHEALRRLMPYRETLQAAVAQGTLTLFTGTAMPLLGRTVTTAEGEEMNGLHLADFTTVESREREPVDVIATSTLWTEPVVGFMNKCSRTSGITTPLFSTLAMGLGNEWELGAEGYRQGSLLATHLTGPILVKNPAFLRYVAEILLGRTLPPETALPYQQEGYAVTLRELQARG